MKSLVGLRRAAQVLALVLAAALLSPQISGAQGPATGAAANSCNARDGRACFTLGTALAANPASQAQAHSAFLTGCRAGDRDSCYNAAAMYETGQGVARNQQNALLYYSKACDLGDRDACKRHLALAPPPTAREVQRNAELQPIITERMQGCRAGHWLDCSRMEEALPEGSPLVLEAGLKGCSLEDRGGCYSAARYYERYSDAPNRLGLALKYYKMACDQGEAIACTKLTNGDLGAAGAAAATSVVQSNEKKCAAGDVGACNWLGLAYADGNNVAVNKAKAFQYFDRACKLGNKTSCENNAEAYRKNAEQAARTDPSRKAGATLTKADLACLKEEDYEELYNKGTSCEKYTRYANGQSVCTTTMTLQGRRTRQKITNVCKRPISFSEYCDSEQPTWSTLLQDETYYRTSGSCRLAY